MLSPNDTAKLEAEVRMRSDMLASVGRTRELLLIHRREATDAATWMALDKSLESNERTSEFLTRLLAAAQTQLDELRAAAGTGGTVSSPSFRSRESAPAQRD